VIDYTQEIHEDGATYDVIFDAGQQSFLRCRGSLKSLDLCRDRRIRQPLLAPLTSLIAAKRPRSACEVRKKDVLSSRVDRSGSYDGRPSYPWKTCRATDTSNAAKRNVS